MVTIIQYAGLQLPTFTMADVKPKEKPRDKFDLGDNETVSMLDPIFSDDRRNVHHLTKEQIIAASKKSVGDHFDQRLQTAFQQFISAYGSGFKFEEGHVEHQGPNARPLGEHAFNAAHSSTVPCLYARDDQGNKVFWLKFSDMYLWANSTNELIKDVNNGDIAIDGANLESKKSRYEFIKLMDRVSEGILTPDKALMAFFRALKKNVDLALQSQTVKGETKLVLEIYKENLEQLELQLNDNPSQFFDRLLSIKSDNLTNHARRIIYKKRYTMIQQLYGTQTAVRKKINKCRAEILQIMNRIDRKPAHFDYIFKATLLSEAMSGKESNFLQRLFSLSKYSLNLDIPRSKAAKEGVNLPKSQSRISKLFNEIRPFIDQLYECEDAYKRELLKELRVCMGHSQRSLSAIFKEKFPKEAMSQSTLCLTERGQRAVNDKLWKQMAQTLEIDQDIFFPLVKNLV